MTNHDVVKKLIGKISPTGESNTDSERLHNLKEMCYLTEMLLMDISDVMHRTRSDPHHSIKKIHDHAKVFLHNTVKDLIKE